MDAALSTPGGLTACYWVSIGNGGHRLTYTAKAGTGFELCPTQDPQAFNSQIPFALIKAADYDARPASYAGRTSDLGERREVTIIGERYYGWYTKRIQIIEGKAFLVMGGLAREILIEATTLIFQGKEPFGQRGRYAVISEVQLGDQFGNRGPVTQCYPCFMTHLGERDVVQIDLNTPQSWVLYGSQAEPVKPEDPCERIVEGLKLYLHKTLQDSDITYRERCEHNLDGSLSFTVTLQQE